MLGHKHIRNTKYEIRNKGNRRTLVSCFLFPNSRSRGFTLVELLVSVGIFVVMTALFMINYGTFNQSVLLTNLAYDIALTVRTAQTYGLSIKGVGSGSFDLSTFQNTYGVHFSTEAPYNGRIVLYSSTISKPPNEQDYIFNHDNDDPTTGDSVVSRYLLKRGAVISGLCVGSGSCTTDVEELSVNFKRPEPMARICAGDFGEVSCSSSNTYAEIKVLSTDGNTRTVQVRSSGQISVLD